MSGRRGVTRREALAAGAGSLAGALLTGCGGFGVGAAVSGSTLGSTLVSTWHDPVGDAVLRVGPGEPLVRRLELGSRAPAVRELAAIAHLTDAHVLDASSPARVTFLDRLGSPFQSTFRPQEALTVQVLAGAVAAIRALRPQLVIQGGDLIDNDQSNELAHALSVLLGGRVSPGSGPRGYYGVQVAADPDPFYYRPDVDAPRHPGLPTAAVRPFVGHGLGARWIPVLGDHDALVAGELVPTSLTESLAVGDRALWDLPRGVAPPPGERLTIGAGAGAGAGASPDGPPQPALVDRLLSQALAGPTVRVPADPARREMSFTEVLARLRGGSGLGGEGPTLDFTSNVGPRLRLIVLDLVRRAGGSGGLVRPGQLGWLSSQLAAAGDRWVVVVSHQPLDSSEGGDALLAQLDRSPRVIATLAGHTHRNLIVPRRSDAGGYWQITTSSLIDYPQQARALRFVETAGGGIAIQTWMLDHVLPGRLGQISRELSYIDAQGGRPKGFAGTRLDRNVVLYRGPGS